VRHSTATAPEWVERRKHKSDIMLMERRIEMPTYEYQCRECNKKFTIVQSISEHGKVKVSCPKCKSKKIQQRISSFMTKTSRKS
jgi:putative FmdB family regulatory protein